MRTIVVEGDQFRIVDDETGGCWDAWVGIGAGGKRRLSGVFSVGGRRSRQNGGETEDAHRFAQGEAIRLGLVGDPDTRRR